MKKAHYYKVGRSYTVEEYVAEFGPKLDSFARDRLRPVLQCVSCRHPMHTVGESNSARDATWAHNPGHESPWCPLKEDGGKRYELLIPTERDMAAGIALRGGFFSSWRIHWAHVLEIVSMCDIHTFINFIKYADSKHLWERAGLQEWLIPYIFLATCDFPPPRSPKGVVGRPYWIRCRFDARIRTSEELWIRVEEDWALIRATYKAPARSAEPSLTHLIDATRIAPDQGFLTRVKAAGNAYQVKAMGLAFPDELP